MVECYVCGEPINEDHLIEWCPCCGSEIEEEFVIVCEGCNCFIDENGEEWRCGYCDAFSIDCCDDCDFDGDRITWTCPHCGTEVDDLEDGSLCPECGWLRGQITM